MAAETTDITPGNHNETLCYLEHILADLHDVAKVLDQQGRDVAALKAELDSFAPVLARFRNNGVTLASVRAARRAANGGG